MRMFTYAADPVVPTSVTEAVVLVIQATRAFPPGPQISTADPKFEVESLAPLEVIAPTVTAAAARAGLTVLASTLESPAATTKCIPLLTALVTASSNGAYPEMVTEMSAMDGRPVTFAVVMTQLIPAMMSERFAEPSSPKAC